MKPIFSSDLAPKLEHSDLKLSVFSALAICAATHCVATELGMAESRATTISVSWRLLVNLPDDRFRSEIELRNNGKSNLGKDWSLYFNSAAKLSPDSAKSEFDVIHINGDFYALRPANRFKPIAPGEHRKIAIEGSPWAINISDAPSGFYLVQGKQGGKVGTPVAVPVRIEPFPAAANLHRGASDIVPVETAESRYLENEALLKLPADQLIKVVPTPVEMKPFSGQVILNQATALFYESPVRNEATYLAGALDDLMDGHVVVKDSMPSAASRVGSIRMKLGSVEVDGRARKKGDEAYVLLVDPENGIEIVGSDAAGVFYGTQTLLCLLPVEAYRHKNDEICLDGVRIADMPRFHYRGLHLDVARNFQTKQTVEKLLGLMGFYKLNRLHLHLADDEGWRIEIKQLPELTSVGGRRGHTLDELQNLVPSQGSGPFADSKKSPGTGHYSQDDFMEILRYAQSRHIDVIPELDMPGHARAAIKSMEARHSRPLQRHGDNKHDDDLLLREPGDKSKYESVQLWHDNVIDVGRDETYRFLDLVIGELSDIYKRADVPLTTIHLGGDEVPTGAWNKSQACNQLILDPSSTIPRRSQLELYFLNRASEILQQHSIQPACWEDCLLLETSRDSAAGANRRASGKPSPTAYVWNNVWGWGREDAAYRLANAGFDVVLCNATHLYFDLACEKDPLEPGYYWAGFVNMRAPFEFIPLDVFKNAGRNAMGQPVAEDSLAGRARLTSEGERHVLGIQGQMWAENLRTPQSVEYMAFPRMIGLAERAWARSPRWALIADTSARNTELDRNWNQFANRMGQRELPRLDYLFGGIRYRLPPPGAAIRNGRVLANTNFPGLILRYTIDGTEPDASSALFHESIPLSPNVKLRSFDTRGRGSRTVSFGMTNSK